MVVFKEGDKIKLNAICLCYNYDKDKVLKLNNSKLDGKLTAFEGTAEVCDTQSHWSLIKPTKNKYCCECNSCIKNAIKEHPKTHIHSYCGDHIKDRVFPKRVKKCKEQFICPHCEYYGCFISVKCTKPLGHRGSHNAVIKW